MTDARISSGPGLGGDAVVGSAVSWAAVLAGAFVSSAFSLALIALGASVGLGSISPWSNSNPTPTTFGLLAVLWLIAIQLFASGIGGYLAGRLRTRWVGVHTHEVYFRDTAHGLLVWAVGAVLSTAILSSAASSAVSGATHAGETAAQAAGSAASGPASQLTNQVAGSSNAYFTDMLFRTDHPQGSGDPNMSQAEIGRIFARALSSGDLPAADKTYVAQVVASRTGMNQADAENRVADTFNRAKSAAAEAADKAKAAADAARKTAVYVALYIFLALLVGAFASAYMATVGGEARDDERRMI